MNYRITSEAQNHAAEIHSMLRVYSAADYSPSDIFSSVTADFDMKDIRIYAATDLMPVRVRGKLYPISETATARLAGSSILLKRMLSEGDQDPATTCANALEYVLTGLKNRRKVSITLIDANSARVALSIAGTSGQIYEIDPIMVLCNALELDDFDTEILVREEVNLLL